MQEQIKAILAGVDDRLALARLGLRDMSIAAHGRSGLYNAVVYGPQVTFALQTLSGKAPSFNEWYANVQQKLKDVVLFMR